MTIDSTATWKIFHPELLKGIKHPTVIIPQISN
jgi:hypothetical protein